MGCKIKNSKNRIRAIYANRQDMFAHVRPQNVSKECNRPNKCDLNKKPAVNTTGCNQNGGEEEI